MTLSGLSGFYFCAVVLLIAFFLAQKVFASPFGMMLRGIKSNQMRMGYTGFNTRPYALTALVISGMYAGLTGALLAVTDPLAGAERMQWTASGRGGADDHPRWRRHADRAGDGRLADQVLREHLLVLQRGHPEARFFDFIPAPLHDTIIASLPSKFVGEGWKLTAGAAVRARRGVPAGRHRGGRTPHRRLVPPPRRAPEKPAPYASSRRSSMR